MSKPRTTKKAPQAVPPEVERPVVQSRKNLLPITAGAEIAAAKAIEFLHPSHGQGLSVDEYHEAISLILEQACLAVVNHRATGTLSFQTKKKGKKVDIFVASAANDCWPPAFDLRKETEDERFARMVLASH